MRYPICWRLFNGKNRRCKDSSKTANQKQPFFTLPMAQWDYKKLVAALVIYSLGSNALPALPTLTNMLFRTNETIPCAIALAGMGPEGIPLAALTNREHRIRLGAACGLGCEQSNLDQIVPALLPRLVDSNRSARDSAIVSLGQLHSFPAVVIPALINCLSSNDPSERGTVLISPAEFETNASAAIPMLRTALGDRDEMVRRLATKEDTK
jgi:hypothetical protein